MQFGVCGDLKIAAIAGRASYDYMEWTVAELLKPRESEEVFCAALDNLRTAALPYPVANCFVPGDLKLTGPEVDSGALRDYVTTTMQRAERAGVEVIVFGSGGARRIPEGFDPEAAWEQLVAFCRMVGPLAHDHGVKVVVEPLNLAECNVLNTVDECATLVNEVAHPGIRLLVDAYHLMRDDDSYDDIVKHGDLLGHLHIATVPNRHAPGAEPCDFSPFFLALAKANYKGRLSIEGKINEPETELPAALTVMRESAAASQRQ
jgi:sugar phosphate isomerase/epimerase